MWTPPGGGHQPDHAQQRAGRALQQFLRFLADLDRPSASAMLRVKLRLESLKSNRRLPRDVPLDQLRLLLAEIEAETASSHGREPPHGAY